MVACHSMAGGWLAIRACALALLSLCADPAFAQMKSAPHPTLPSALPPMAAPPMAAPSLTTPSLSPPSLQASPPLQAAPAPQMAPPASVPGAVAVPYCDANPRLCRPRDGHAVHAHAPHQECPCDRWDAALGRWVPAGSAKQCCR
jgi:hypothetical protein